MKKLVIYPGRFQPFHKGHAQVYQWLKNKFGDAIIATSDKVEAPKSPFNFNEKKQMMRLAGIPAGKIKQVLNPYMAKEILKDYDPQTTVLIFAVSQKDMDEDPRFSFKPTKSGKPGYLQPYAGNEKKLKPFGDPQKMTGYVVVTPTFTFNVLGKPATSASELRKQFMTLDNKKQKDFITDLFGKYDADIHKLMKKKIGAMQKTIKQLKEEVTRKELAPMLDSFVSFASDKLGLKSMPALRYKTNDDDYNSFAAYNPSKNELSISTMNRHPMDIFRSIAHELVHHKQNEDGRLGKNIAKEGETGSNIENEANAEAGKIMRWFAKTNPDMFGKSYVIEDCAANSISNCGIRGMGYVTGEVSPTIVSHYLTKNISDTESMKKSNKTHILDTGEGEWKDEEEMQEYKKKNLTEGINDPGKLKAIFLAGGPGSGKDYVMNATLAGEGLKEINSDVAFEYLMTKNGLDLEMPDEEKVERDIVRGRAKNITKEQERLALAGRLGLIINGTADDLEKISRIKKGLEDDGYETMMVFVNTSNDVSRERNVERGKMGKRKVPDGTDKQGVPDNSPNIRQEKWDLAQENIGELQKIFGNDKFTVIDNTADIRKVGPEEKAKVLTNFNRVRRMAQQFVRSDNRNPEAQKWIEAEAKKRGITNYQAPKRSKTLTQIRTEVPKVVHKPDNALMLQARRLGLSYYGFGRFGRKVGGVNKVLFHSKGGKLVRVQTMNEEKKMKNDPCWKGYEMIGKKNKNGKEVPNCVPVSEEKSKKKFVFMSKKGKVKKPLISMDENFEKYMENSANREVGTSSLASIYKKMTPGQEIEEDNNIPKGGLPVADGIGPMTTQYRPMTGSGFTGVGNSVYEKSDSIKKWANDEKTKAKFAEKYGKKAEQKLAEAALKLEAAGCGMPMMKPKSVKKIKETFGAASSGKDPADTLSPIGNQNKDSVSETSLNKYKKKIDFRSTEEKKHAALMDEEQERIRAIQATIAEAIDKAKMKCNKPRADNHNGKSHVVKACTGGQEKIIRFGQAGVKGSPDGSSRNERFKKRHAKNIAKGPSSAAYWANKVKW
jgi:cytidyltransferase-like protein